MRFNSFLSMLDYWSRIQPDQPVFLFDKGGKKQSLSYCSFLEQVQQKAKELQASGYRCFGILCNGQIDCVIAIFACAAIKAQAVLLDPTLPEEILKKQMREGDVECILDLSEKHIAISRNSDDIPVGQRFLFFTSGTTHDARAVMLTEQNLCASAFNGASMLPMQRNDLLLCLLPLNHVFGFVCGMLWGLQCGATVALGRGLRFMRADCERYRPTVMSVVPAMLDYLFRSEALNQELKTILIGAGPCTPQMISKVQERGVLVSFGYGLTETSSGVAISVQGDPFAMSVCPDDEIHIADDGEILIKAPTCMMQGYYKDSRSTSEVLQNEFLQTGDIGFFDAKGKLHITGRKKETVVLPDGTKIFLPDYERRILTVIPDKDLAVVWKNEVLTLVISGGVEDKNELFRKLDPVLSLYSPSQQIREIQFTKDPLPRTATGKLMRWKI